MKTLVFNASPRKNGDTAKLLEVLRENLSGEILVVNCYFDKISPCIDCRKCREADACVIDDYMQQVYPFLEECDNVVVATPIYFSQPTGKYLDVASRFQRYFSRDFFAKKPCKIKPKRGGVILVGGGTGKPNDALKTIKTTLSLINTNYIFPAVISHNTDKISANDDLKAMSEVKNLALKLNEST